MSGFVVWFTGLSGSGKSTLAAMLSAELRRRGVHVEVLDGDDVRTHLSKGLGFSREDRDTNIRRIGWVAKLVARSGACAMTAAISPYKAIREEQRAASPRFVEVYCRCSIPVLADRDPKGLYKKALAGEIKHFTGVDDPYEEPDAPEVLVDTGAEPKEESLARIVAKLEELGYVRSIAGASTTEDASGKLVAPHGGELVSRFVEGADRALLEALAATLPVIDLDARGEGDVELIASGAFSPLKGFMTSKDYLRVVRDLRLENGLPWSIPITLAVPAATAGALAVGSRAALRARDGRLVAVIDVADRWAPDRDLEARAIHDTHDTAHPGVARLASVGATYVGGEIHVIERPTAPFPAHRIDPREARARFAERGWTRVVGFHTRSPMHRAEEHITKAALEGCDGLLIHAAVDVTDPLDFPAAVRVRCYEALLGGYYNEDRAVLSIDAGATRHAGAREVLLNAIVSKNHGSSHFVVERDFAGALRSILDTFGPGELGVEPLFFEDAFWSATAGAMATATTAPEKEHAPEITVNERIRRGELPPAEVTRPEVARILLEAMRERSLR